MDMSGAMERYGRGSGPCGPLQTGEPGKATFADGYREVAQKYLKLLDYGPDDPFAYGYNDACTAFANGESAMYPIGSYAIPQILTVNPDMNIDSLLCRRRTQPMEIR